MESWEGAECVVEKQERKQRGSYTVEKGRTADLTEVRNRQI